MGRHGAAPLLKKGYNHTPGRAEFIALCPKRIFSEATANEKQLEQHVPILGVLHLVGGTISATVGIFLFVFLSGIGAVVDDPMAFRVLTVVGFTVGIFLVVLSAPGIVAGYGLLKRRSWARSLAVAVGALNLLNIPIGTVIGVYSLIVLLQDDEDGYFVALKGA